MAILQILIFPGFLFLAFFGTVFEFVDRKVYARLQSRKGPPWYQPIADFIKLLGKETIIPTEANAFLFVLFPLVTLAAVSTAFLSVPVWGTEAVMAFQGDMIVVLVLLMLCPICFFLAGWNSSSMYSTIGSQRVLTSLFAYEVPLLMAVIGPAILTGSWSLSGIAAFYGEKPLLALLNLPGFAVALLAGQGKLERVPFDTPEAETEIVAGAFTEYSGRPYAFFRLAIDMELVVLPAIFSAVFIPVFVTNVYLGFGLFVLKTLVILLVLTSLRAITARLRIEQMVRFCWLVLVPLALLQILINLVAKGLIL
ncbi:MAG: NADH-quinone oxidoreductase subunit H [Coriobacteriia bacterium]|nr:NADH-quinone oxidoreductase subunit H [Coriobacteriia bacterium]